MADGMAACVLVCRYGDWLGTRAPPMPASWRAPLDTPAAGSVQVDIPI